MKEIRKKKWPEYFKKILNGEKNIEVRLADFKLNKGDILIFEEYNPKTKKYTGRVIKKKVKNLTKFKILDAYSVKDLKKFGIYEIELEGTK